MQLGHQGLECRVQRTRILLPLSPQMPRGISRGFSTPHSSPRVTPSWSLPCAPWPGSWGPAKLPSTYLPPTEKSDTA